MMSWRRELYEYDIAQDIVNTINDMYTSKDENSAIERIISMLDKEYQDEDKSVAMIIAADYMLKRGVYNVFPLYKRTIVEHGELHNQEIENIKQLIRNPDFRKKPKKKRVYYKTDWNIGDVFLYDISQEFIMNEGFIGWNVGFLCVGFYEYRGKHPIVYAFRTTCSQTEIAAKLEIAINSVKYWRVCNWGNSKYAYIALLWTEYDRPNSKEQFHYCGNTNIRPSISDEFVVLDTASHPRLLREAIENSLLRTLELNRY